MMATHPHTPNPALEVQATETVEQTKCQDCGLNIHRPASPGEARNRNPWTLRNEPLIHATALLRTAELPDEEMPALLSLYHGASEGGRRALLAALYHAYGHDSYTRFQSLALTK